jgi:protein-L-isoaspartate(D-aspartate) O-methyltransferase
VPPEYADSAYHDEPIPIPLKQVTTQPSLSANMIQAQCLTGDKHVLEIGTGYGYQAALLARLAAFVTSIERWSDLAAQAHRNLLLTTSTTWRSWRAMVQKGCGHASYDAVIVSAASRGCLVRSSTSCGRTGVWCSRLALAARVRWSSSSERPKAWSSVSG